jgi:TfoX/Sxy family transcriptional regulator of competence genes
MAYNELLADRIRNALHPGTGIQERKMFGGLCFTLRGNMLTGVVGDDLMVRLGEAAYPDAVRRKGARPMDFTGRPMKGYVLVNSTGCANESDLRDWMALALNFVGTLPAKTPAKKS